DRPHRRRDDHHPARPAIWPLIGATTPRVTERGAAPGHPELPTDPERARDSAALEGQPAAAILAAVLQRHAGRRIGLSSAFGPEGCALIHLARALAPAIPIYTI